MASVFTACGCRFAPYALFVFNELTKVRIEVVSIFIIRNFNFRAVFIKLKTIPLFIVNRNDRRPAKDVRVFQNEVRAHLVMER